MGMLPEIIKQACLLPETMIAPRPPPPLRPPPPHQHTHTNTYTSLSTVWPTLLVHKKQPHQLQGTREIHSCVCLLRASKL